MDTIKKAEYRKQDKVVSEYRKVNRVKSKIFKAKHRDDSRQMGASLLREYGTDTATTTHDTIL
jgi:hypothetical protein